MTGESFEEHWPRYPSDGSGHKLMDLTVECDVDKLFKLQWDSSSEFLAKSQEVRGNKEFVATPWVGSSDEMEAAAKTANTAKPDQTLEPKEYESKLRKTTCNSFGMGMKFQTFEVQRCIEANEGQQFVMNTCVMTTATYGEKFRPCFKYTLKADGEKKSRLQVEYQLVYVTSVNAFIKKAIERGASNGINKNFETVQEVLKDFVTFHEYGKQPAAGKPPAPSQKAETSGEGREAAPQQVAQPKGPRQPWWTGVMDRRFVGSFEPLAAWLKAQTRAGGTAVPRDGVSLTATGLALALMIFSIYCIRSMLHGIHTWLVSCTGISGWIFKTLFGWMDVPDSLCEVFLSFCLLVVTHTALRHLAAFASDFLEVPEQPKKASTNSVADSDGPDGTRYDGYEDAYNDASSSMTEEGSSSPTESSQGQRVRHRDVWKQQIKENSEKTNTQIKHGFKEFRRMMADGWKQHLERHDEKKEEKKERKESKRHLRHSRNNSDVSVDSVEDIQLSASSNNSLSAAAKGKPAVSGTTSSKSLSSDSALRAPGPTPSRDQAAHAPLSVPATASSPGSATITDKPALGTSPPKAVKSQHSPSSGTVTSVMTPLLEKTDHVLASWGFSRGNTMQSKQAEGASTSQAEASGRTGDPDLDASNSVTSVVTPLLEKTDNYLASWGLTTSASNPKSEDETAVQGSSPSAVQASPSTAVQVSSLSAPQAAAVTGQNGAEEQNIVITADRHKTYSETDLAEMETAAGPVEEEVFENERFQPFKGWGHGWPGNFLPTDKVGHWSHRNGTPGKAASMAFSTVAPKLPKGWSWVEEGWVVDHQGIADDAVDADGWSYATDFSWLRMPPAPNSGHRSKVRDFVRRRRWIRSRVKKPAESQALQGASASSSPIFGHSASSFNADSRPQLSKVSTTSSTGTGPIFGRPSGMFAGHDGAPAANTSFTSQRNMTTAGQLSPPRGTGAEGVSSTGMGQSDLASLRGGSSHSLGGAMPGRSSGTEERPYMNLSDVRSGLSNECSKWGQSVASELHKAISSAGEDNGSLARDSLHSEDYVGNSPMSAGLTRLSGPATSFQSGSGPPTATASYPTTAAVTSQHRLNPQFVRDSTPQTLGTAGGIPVAPQLAQATGHANISAAGGASQSTDSRPTEAAPQGMPSFAERQSAGNVAVQHSTAEDFPASEELTVEDSAPSAPAAVFGQVRHGRLQMSEEPPLAAFPASSVAAGLAGPSGNVAMMQNIDRDVGHADTPKFEQSSPLGHHHSYERAGVVLARPADGSAAKLDQ